MLILPILAVAILGMRAALLGAGSTPLAFLNFEDIGHDGLISLVLIIMAYGAGFIYNQLHDVESDRANGKLFFLGENIISPIAARFLALLLILGAVIAAFALDWRQGLLFMGILVLGLLYSHPLFNYKGKAGKALWSNMLGCGSLPFMIGWVSLTGSLNLEGMVKSVPYLLAAGAVYLNTTLPDREGDKRVGKNTYGVLWTVAHTQNSALTRLVLALLTGLMAGDFAILIASGVALPFFILAALQKRTSLSVLATKVAILAMIVMAGFALPPFVAFALIVIGTSRVYYQQRFHLNYPSLP